MAQGGFNNNTTQQHVRTPDRIREHKRSQQGTPPPLKLLQNVNNKHLNQHVVVLLRTTEPLCTKFARVRNCASVQGKLVTRALIHT